MSFFGRIWLNFGFKKVTCCLYHSGTVRHSTVNGIVSTSVFYGIGVFGPLKQSFSTSHEL